MTTVETTYGRIQGTEEAGLRVFRGVPYARAPLGELRFAPPRTPVPWTGTRPAVAFGPAAPQVAPSGPAAGEVPASQDEDCLTLNIWTPGTDGARRPVLVWVHGGGFAGGAGSLSLYDGRHLATRGDVVVVTLNYRLGILGFLAHPDLAADGAPRGNWGLLDQVAALQWVQQHVAAFGGDPANVTVFGESAGAMSVCDLMVMPAAAGLFHRAIAQSGPPVAVSMDQAEERANRVLSALELARPSQLRGVPVEALLEAQVRVLAGGGGGLGWSPAVDGTSLPKDPRVSFEQGEAAPVPLLIGTNRDEAKLFLVADPKNRDPDEAVVLERLERAFAAARVGLAPERAIDTYRAARAARGEPTDPRQLWSAIATDQIFRIGSIRAAEAHARRQPDTYCYLFTWESPAMRGALGACHALEIPFVFGNLDAPGMDRFAGSGQEAAVLSEVMMDAWLAFARTGRPGHNRLPQWPPYEPTARATMVLGPEIQVLERPMDQERALWEAAFA
jgi:para-nitrobenzyl esterase